MDLDTQAIAVALSRRVMLLDQIGWPLGTSMSQIGRQALSCGDGVPRSQKVQGALGVTIDAEYTFQFAIAEHNRLPGS
jgi:hypothetical protein